MNSLEKLAVRQFELTTAIKRWKTKSGLEIFECEQKEDEELCQRYAGKFTNHIQATKHEFETQEPEWPDGRTSFGEILSNDFDCPHCDEWYRIQRKEILPLKLQLRSVRAAITRIGKRLSQP